MTKETVAVMSACHEGVSGSLMMENNNNYVVPRRDTKSDLTEEKTLPERTVSDAHLDLPGNTIPLLPPCDNTTEQILVDHSLSQFDTSQLVLRDSTVRQETLDNSGPISQPHLLLSSEIPKQMREPYILSHYRPLGKPGIFYARSLFKLHNETCNIWSHLIPAFFMIYKCIDVAIRYDVSNDVTLWPLIMAYVGGAVTMLMSATSHTFAARSQLDHHLYFQLDYLGISVCLQSIGTGLYFLASTEEFYEIFGSWPLYLGWVAAGTIVVFGSIGRLYHEEYLTLYLAGAGIFAMLVNISPVLYRFHAHIHIAYDHLLLTGHTSAQLVTLTGILVYISRIPERFCAGRCDVFGHSHTIFHLLTACGMYIGTESATAEYTTRSLEMRMLCQPSFWSATGGLFFITMVGFVTIYMTSNARKNNVIASLRETQSHLT